MVCTPIYCFSVLKGKYLEPATSSHPIEVEGYEIRPNFISLVKELNFVGGFDENPYKHLQDFKEIYAQQGIQTQLFLIVTLNFLAIFGELCGLNWGTKLLFSTTCHPQTDDLCKTFGELCGLTLCSASQRIRSNMPYLMQARLWAPAELHHNGEGTSCRGLCYREVQVILSGC
jgi:hypothetical protein